MGCTIGCQEKKTGRRLRDRLLREDDLVIPRASGCTLGCHNAACGRSPLCAKTCTYSFMPQRSRLWGSSHDDMVISADPCLGAEASSVSATLRLPRMVWQRSDRLETSPSGTWRPHGQFESAGRNPLRLSASMASPRTSVTTSKGTKPSRAKGRTACGGAEHRRHRGRHVVAGRL
jgi:hypothetical protein